MHRFFFQSSYKAVGDFWEEEIGEEKEVNKDSLRCEDDATEDGSRLTDRKESHEVHSLVFGLLEQGTAQLVGKAERQHALDPTSIATLYISRVQNLGHSP